MNRCSVFDIRGRRCSNRLMPGWTLSVCSECQMELQRKPPAPTKPPIPYMRVVYYLVMGQRVKIGFSSALPTRVASLSLPVSALAAIEPGGRKVEKRRHQQFADLRIAGTEWFELSEDLQAHVDHLRAGVEDPWKQWRFMVEREKSSRVSSR